MDLIFTPILKTKRVSEYHALEEIKNLILENSLVIPYLECTKPIDHNDVKKYRNLLNDKTYFFEPKKEDVCKMYDDIGLQPHNCIIVLKIDRETSLNDIDSFINKNREANRSFGIKINNSDSRFLSEIKKLTHSEYLFIELEGTSFFSSSFLDDVLDLSLNAITIIHSNERFQYLRGEDFVNDGFNKKINFNTSIIDSIKKGIFSFDGFGSRCSTKNENTEDVKIARKVNGYFLVFDYKENNFYSLVSKKKDHVSKVYTIFKEELIDKKPDLDTMFLNSTPKARDVLDAYLKKEKLSSNKIITVSIIRYIENIIYELYI